MRQVQIDECPVLIVIPHAVLLRGDPFNTPDSKEGVVEVTPELVLTGGESSLNKFGPCDKGTEILFKFEGNLLFHDVPFGNSRLRCRL